MVISWSHHRRTSIRVSKISVLLGFTAIDHDPAQTCYKRTGTIEIMAFEIGRLWRSERIPLRFIMLIKALDEGELREPKELGFLHFLASAILGRIFLQLQLLENEAGGSTPPASTILRS